MNNRANGRIISSAEATPNTSKKLEINGYVSTCSGTAITAIKGITAPRLTTSASELASIAK
jgi:hypothetical protein